MKLKINNTKDAWFSLLGFLIAVPILWCAFIIILAATIWSLVVSALFVLLVGLFTCGVIVKTDGTETTGNE